MSTFNSFDGQSLFDVCLNTYGSLDYLYKLLQDSNVASINEPVKSNQQFNWDSTLIIDQAIYRTTTLTGKIFATAASNNLNTYYLIIGESVPVSPSIPYTPPNNYNQPMQYQKSYSTSYTALTDGEKIISLPQLAGKDILQIEKEIKPLKATDFTWNKTTAVLTLNDEFAMYTGETLYILATEIVTI